MNDDETTAPEPEEPLEPQAEPEPERPQAEDAEAQMRRLSRRGFIWTGVSLAAAVGAYVGIDRSKMIDWEPGPLRKGLRFDESVSEALRSPTALAPTFSPKDISPEARVNAHVGLPRVFDPASWRLRFEAGSIRRELTLKDLQALPQAGLITQLNCVEGWTQIFAWKGIWLRDLLHSLVPNPSQYGRYVAMETQDQNYYVGLDLPSCLHPQSMLAWQMNGAPLPWAHGQPLRLVMPIKYGYKQIKSVGLIRLTDKRPPDYWAELGYDWYGGF